MAVLKNKTQGDFTMISNNVLRDKELSMKDRGVLCTICSLPDGWEFSIGGLSAISPDGVDAIRASIMRLEKMGYMERTKTRQKDGKYASEIEVFSKKQDITETPLGVSRDGKSNTDNPTWVNQDGFAKTEKPREYKKDNNKRIINNDNASINLSEVKTLDDRKTDIKHYRDIIAENIKLDWLIEAASSRNENEVGMVNEIYSVICDMVCYPRDQVTIKGTRYPWDVVKKQFLKLQYQHIADVLNRIVDSDLNIKNMSSYLISTLYTQSMVGTLEAEARIHDDYLKYLRGNPYTT